MKKLCIPIVLFLLCLASFASAESLIGCTTHAAWQDDAGVWHIYGCPEHGETALDGSSDIRQMEIRLHVTIALHDNGRLTVHGMTSLPVAEIEAWDGIKEFALKDQSVLVALKDDGTIRLAHGLDMDPENEYDRETMAAFAAAETLTGVQHVFSNESRIGFLCDDDYAAVLSYREFTQWRTRYLNISWDQFRKIQVADEQLIALSDNNELYQIMPDRNTLIQNHVIDFDLSDDYYVYVLMDDHTLLLRSIEASGSESQEWEDGFKENNPHRIDTLIGAEGTFIAATRGWDIVTEGCNGESDFWAEISPAVLPSYSVEGSKIVQALIYNGYFLIRHENGTIHAVLCSGMNMDYAAFNAPDNDVQAFMKEDGPARQLLHRELSGRVAYPYAVKEDGTVILLDPDCPSYIQEVLTWTNVAGIATANVSTSIKNSGIFHDYDEATFVAAVTRDGRVLTACQGENQNALAACAEASAWNHMIQITCYGTSIAGVTDEGRVLVAGTPKNMPQWQTWDHVVLAVLAGCEHDGPWDGTYLYALKDDGTVLGGLYGLTKIVTLKGGNQFIIGIKSDHTAVGFGYNFLQDCCVHGLAGVWDAAVNMEWAGYTPYIGVDGRVYKQYSFLQKVYEGFEDVDHVVAVYQGKMYSQDHYYALTEDGTLYSTGGKSWNLR